MQMGSGVLGFITNHSYLDSPTFRGMRWHLLKTFDSIHVVDLHGSSMRQETPPDGTIDKNMFDIMQGVAIIVAAKTSKNGNLATVHRGDLWGARAAKSADLFAGSLDILAPKAISPNHPRYMFIEQDEDALAQFETGFSINTLFGLSGNGVVTKRDALCIQPTAAAVWDSMLAFKNRTEAEVRKDYRIPADVRDWRYEWAKADVLEHFDRAYIAAIQYRPFDTRYILYTGNARGFVGWPVLKVMSNYLTGPNLGLLAPKANRDAQFAHALVTDKPTEAIFLSGTTGSNAMNFPLYCYPSESERRISGSLRQPNLDLKLYAAVCAAARVDPADQAGPDDDFRSATGNARPSEVKVFDYIYGVLHAPNYRETYAEFLKIDFPRIPYPASPEVFAHISEKGEALRRLHLMEAAAIGDTPYPYHGEGDDVVASGYPKIEGGKVQINQDQYFADVPAIAWGFHIGGYQPAQKWLKDRRGRALSWDDIGHYQKIVKILSETDRVMKEIELPLD